MLRKDVVKTTELEFASIDALVPSGHLLRKVGSAIDFTFICERVVYLYCATTDARRWIR